MNDAEYLQSKELHVVHPPMQVYAGCIGCGSCESVCPTGALKVIDTAEIDPNICIGCGACAGRCTMGAIG